MPSLRPDPSPTAIPRASRDGVFQSAALGVALCVAVVATLTVLRAIFAVTIELRVDEAYYWTWSKESALSFLDHPPLIAWFVRFGTAIFGDTTLGVRFGGIVAMLVRQ